MNHFDWRLEVKRAIGGSLARVIGIMLLLTVRLSVVYGQEPKSLQDADSASHLDDTIHVHEALTSSLKMDEMPRRRFQDMLTNVPGDWVKSCEVVTESRTLPYIAGLGAMTGLLMATDKQTNCFSRRMMASSPAVRSASSAFVRLGDGKTHIALAAGFALYGLIRDDSRSIRTGSETVEALLACGIAVQALKRVAGRESPQAATSSHGVWRFFPNLRTYQRHQARYYAFPSGHIATTMATMTVIAENYPEVSWIRPVGYSVIGCLGVSLVNVGYHWYSDLPLGLAMGYMFGMIASHHEDGLFAFLGNDPYSGLQVLPAVTRAGTGVTLALLF